jgi:hypothetical protein
VAVLIASLVALRATFNRAAPRRDKTSDGWIGNAAHAATVSSHNPDESGNVPIHDADRIDEVHAIDVDGDLNATDARGRFTMMRAVRQLVVDHRAGRESRLRYIIFERTIWSASWGWAAREYTGANPHDHHMHADGSYDSAKERDTRPWNIGFVETDMALTDKFTTGRYAGQTMQDALNDIGTNAALAAGRTDYLANKLGLASRLDAILAAAVDDGNTTVTMTPEDRAALAAQLAEAIAAPTAAEIADAVQDEAADRLRE